MPFVKGQRANPNGRPKGSLNKETLNKLERRAIFEKEVQAMFIETIKKARPEYLLDQFLGKAPDIIEGTIKTEPTERIREIAKILKEKDL